MMKSNLIADTTKQERIALIKQWLPDDDADYINGIREISEINAAMTGTFYTEDDL